MEMGKKHYHACQTAAQDQFYWKENRTKWVFAAYQKFLSPLDFSEIQIFRHFLPLEFGHFFQKWPFFYKNFFWLTIYELQHQGVVFMRYVWQYGP